MHSFIARTALCSWIFFTSLASAQSSSTASGPVSATASGDAGYVGYNLTLEGDEDSVIYATENTRADADLIPNPDVFLNASVHVGTIDIEVDELTAKINLDAQVLNLLTFNAGVDLSIDSVRLLIENVNAKVLLEVRLDNLVRMINKTLSSIDLNPIIAELGNSLGEIVGDVGDVVGGITGGSGSSNSTSDVAARGLNDQYELEHNILYSTNNYRQSRHTNRVLAQNGDIVDQTLDNGGNDLGRTIVGNYKTDMTFTGDEREAEFEGQAVTEKEYEYAPFAGLYAISYVYFDAAGDVVGTQVVAEAFGGGMSTVNEDLK